MGRTEFSFKLASKGDKDDEFSFEAKGSLFGESLTEEEVKSLCVVVGKAMHSIKEKRNATPKRLFN